MDSVSNFIPAPVFHVPQLGETTLGSYLIQRLVELGVGHIFGIPGDYVLGFMKKVEASPIEMVGTTNELCAGYAADAYARVRGLGVCCVTYAVGGFSLANAIAGAYAEKSPVILISGAPGVRERLRKGLYTIWSAIRAHKGVFLNRSRRQTASLMIH